jgi:hypothetical protein
MMLGTGRPFPPKPSNDTTGVDNASIKWFKLLEWQILTRNSLI